MEMLVQDDTRDLPPMARKAVDEARDVLARTSDPQLSDMILDRACFKEMSEIAEASQSVFLQKYVSLWIDSANLRTVVRAARIGKGIDFLRGALVEGGSVDKGRLVSVAVSESPIAECYIGNPLEEAAAAGMPAIRGEVSLTVFERMCDDALIRHLKSAKLVAFGEQPLIAYIAAKESEIISIRTILSGRQAGIPHELIRERLREAYV